MTSWQKLTHYFQRRYSTPLEVMHQPLSVSNKGRDAGITGGVCMSSNTANTSTVDRGQLYIIVKKDIEINSYGPSVD